MRAAFGTAISRLRSKPGGAPASWSWGKLHSRRFQSLTGAAALEYGPYPSGGDAWTVDAAYGGAVSGAGPSWRMIVGWTGSGRAAGEAIYPGGQSENPASPWYANLFGDWRSGRYLPMPVAGRVAGGGAGSVAGGGGGAGAVVGAVAGGGSGGGGADVSWELRP
jgi:penicillin amidase